MNNNLTNTREKLIFSIGITAGFLVAIKELEFNNSNILNLQDICFNQSKNIVNEITKEGKVNINSVRLYSELLSELHKSITKIKEKTFYNSKIHKSIDISEHMENVSNAIKHIKDIVNT